MSEFYRFPHTPHIAWLGREKPRDDKILAPSEVSELLAGEVVVEEKVDGANLGFSVGADGRLNAQNRGSYLELEAPKGQWKPLKRWLSTRREALVEALGTDLVLFGEWCYAVHSVRYTKLPDWFLAFDVYDRVNDTFWSADRRNALVRPLGIETVPEVARGHQTVESLKALLQRPSQLVDDPPEGIYMRREAEGLMRSRAKLVRAEFVQAIEEHWSRRALEENQLAEGHPWRHD